MRKVIVAPLNWGLGHATRCIPIIKELQQFNFTPVIASDGDALLLLQKEFPKLEYIQLPPYNIRYGKSLKKSLLKQAPKILKAIQNERKVIKKYIATSKGVIGIISDNRLGVRSKKVPSAYITHQLKVLSGWGTLITSTIHRSMIKKFDECWIPDESGSLLSGKLSVIYKFSIPVKYMGVLSRFTSKNLPLKNDILIILSGPEPNRTVLEEKLISEFQSYSGKILLVRGVLEEQQQENHQGNIKIINYLLSTDLEKELNQSNLVICRSGFSSIMDLARLGKKAFLIPTKGQNEQEYLAKYLEKKRIAPYENEEKFEIKNIEKINLYDGFSALVPKFNDDLLHLFERKRKS